MTKVDTRAAPRTVTQSRPAEKLERTAEVAPAAGQTTQPVEFFELARSLASLQPRSQHVGRSADPGALWGQAQTEDPRTRFQRASPEERAQMVAQVKAQRAEMEGKISERADKLERRFRRMNGGKRVEMIQRHLSESASASPTLKKELEGYESKAQAMQVEIDQMRAELLKSYPPKTDAEKADRRERMKELIELRKHQREVLNEATDKLGAAGQKLELLAKNETDIDPKAAATPEESLMSMIGKWLGYNMMLNTFDHFLEQTRINLQDQQKKIEREIMDKAISDSDNLRKAQVKSDLQQREALKMLAQRIDGVREG